MTAHSPRIDTLDAVRGLAVMGIVLMNIISFGFPEAAYVNPLAMGPASLADLASWAFMSIAVDGKMRAIFSILFGASMLLICDRAEAAGENPAKVHMQRMGWLLVFGLLHMFLVWTGDILTLYAMVGIAALPLLMAEPKQWRWIALAAFAFNFILLAALVMGWHETIHLATLPGATADQMDEARSLLDHLGRPGSPDMAAELTAYRGSYWDILRYRWQEDSGLPLQSLLSVGPETFGYMTLGMILLRNGFLAGRWETGRYRRLMLLCYTCGLPPLLGLQFWAGTRGFDAVSVVGTALVWAMPFRILVAVGHLALFMLLLRIFEGSRLFHRIAATGRMAFSNYLATSLLMTSLFYGYGGALFGQLSRWQCYALVPLVWLMMLGWSAPWLKRFRYGPLEWLWRSAARGEWQPMRR